MSSSWPLPTCKIGQAKAVEAVIEPRVGVRWYERGRRKDVRLGPCARSGTAVADRALLGHQADWQHDPNLKTEVEVRFVEEGRGGTRVELEHRHLDRYGARRDQMRGIFDSDGGWMRRGEDSWEENEAPHQDRHKSSPDISSPRRKEDIDA